MKIIGIDYSLATSTTRGIGRYTREIVKSLIDIDTTNKYILYTHKEIDILLPENFIERRIPTSNEVIAMQYYIPIMAMKDKIDVLWCSGNVFPVIFPSKIKLVVTLHDLIFLAPKKKNATVIQKIGRQYRRFVIFFGKKRVNEWVSVSKYSANEIINKLKISNVTITYNRIDNFYKMVALMNKPSNRQNFYFTVSGEAPSKNLSFLIDTFIEKLPDKKLIIAGISKNASIRAKGSENILFLPQGIPDNDLIWHYLNCKAFLFISLLEGFGIPILEAMVCDAPIISSNTTSLPEVVGEFGIMIDPTNNIELIDAIKKIEDFTYLETEKIEHLKKFLNWKDSALIIKKIFEQ